eukprot:GHRR01022459.1.p1 GENE.GHRR01022459.1~~GHRR01022459.1.p1  ORF type:complete len:145 (+),score=12.52 GHRR01022459.1:78-512(+)
MAIYSVLLHMPIEHSIVSGLSSCLQGSGRVHSTIADTADSKCLRTLVLSLHAISWLVSIAIPTTQGHHRPWDMDSMCCPCLFRSRFQTSTKIEALREELDLMHAADPGAKAIVFSQFTSMLELIAFRLDQVGKISCPTGIQIVC